MLLELKQSQLLVNNKPLAEDMKLAIWPDRKNFRLKLNYCGEGESEPVDLSIDYELPKFQAVPPAITVGFHGVALDPENPGRKLKQFRFTLALNLLKGGLRVIGVFGNKQVDRTITTPVEILEIIKSVL